MISQFLVLSGLFMIIIVYLFKWYPLVKQDKYPFLFENMWTLNPNFPTHFLKWWNCKLIDTDMFLFVGKLKVLKEHLKHWTMFSFGNIFEQNDRIKEKLHSLQKEM